jgi:hypothetical protein
VDQRRSHFRKLTPEAEAWITVVSMLLTATPQLSNGLLPSPAQVSDNDSCSAVFPIRLLDRENSNLQKSEISGLDEKLSKHLRNFGSYNTSREGVGGRASPLVFTTARWQSC